MKESNGATVLRVSYYNAKVKLRRLRVPVRNSYLTSLKITTLFTHGLGESSLHCRGNRQVKTAFWLSYILFIEPHMKPLLCSCKHLKCLKKNSLLIFHATCQFPGKRSTKLSSELLIARAPRPVVSKSDW